MNKCLAAGFVLMLMLGAAAQAQEASPAAPPAQTAAKSDPDALAAAHELLGTMDIKSMMSGMVDALLPIESAAIRREHSDVSPEAIAMFESAFREEFSSSEGKIEDIYAVMYAEHFSASELRQLNAFYKTQLGQKVLHQIPVLMKELQPVAIAFGQDLAARVRERVSGELKKKGESL